MVKKKTQATVTRPSETEVETENDTIESEPDQNYHSVAEQSDVETADERDTTVVTRAEIVPRPSEQIEPTSPRTPRRSLRLRKKQRQTEHVESDESEPENQGDTAGVYGTIKGAIQDMTTQVVTAIQTAIKGVMSQTHRRSKSDTGIESAPKNAPAKSRSVPMMSRISRSRLSTVEDDDQSTDSSDDESDEESDDTENLVQAKKPTRYSQSFKLPAYTGKEKWEVWYHRFEAVAKLNNWNDKNKLLELLPRLQGAAGDFAYDQLSQKTLNSYERITKELQNRFGLFETTKNYKVMFTRRNQKSGESVETYAAELKRIYDKAYTNRDRRTRQEDLLQRFLMGLIDNKTRVYIELHRDPNTIEEAVQEVITYLETTNGPQLEEQTGGRFRKQVRQLKTDNRSPQWNTGQINGKRPNQRHGDQSRDRGYPGSEQTNFQAQLDEMKKMIQELHACNLKKNGDDVPNTNRMDRGQGHTANKQTENNFLCYFCGRPGHYAKFCYSNPNREIKPFVPGKQWTENMPMDKTPLKIEDKTGKKVSFPEFALN